SAVLDQAEREDWARAAVWFAEWKAARQRDGRWPFDVDGAPVAPASPPRALQLALGQPSDTHTGQEARMTLSDSPHRARADERERTGAPSCPIVRGAHAAGPDAARSPQDGSVRFTRSGTSTSVRAQSSAATALPIACGAPPCSSATSAAAIP